ncbi:unnamed protein product [Penicillium discolor]
MKISTFRNDKGSNTVSVSAYGVFGGSSARDENVEVTHVQKQQYALVDIADGNDFLALRDDNGNLREDLQLPKGNLGESLKACYGKNEDIVGMLSVD